MTERVKNERVLEAGFIRPAWATGHCIDTHRKGEIVALNWVRASETTIGAISPTDDTKNLEVSPSVSQWDSVSFDLEAGTMKTRQGEPLIYIYDDLEVTPDEARKLAVVLVELADLADGVTK